MKTLAIVIRVVFVLFFLSFFLNNHSLIKEIFLKFGRFFFFVIFFLKMQIQIDVQTVHPQSFPHKLQTFEKLFLRTNITIQRSIGSRDKDPVLSC